MNNVQLIQKLLGRPAHRSIAAATRVEELQSLLHALAPIDPGIDLMRVGPMHDGGYLLPDDLHDIRACFSPGVSSESGFELECAKRGMKVFMADASVDGPAADHPLFSFRKMFIGAVPAENFITLDDWVSSELADSFTAGDIAPAQDLLLQMDVEGYEYEILLNASATLLRRMRVVVCEFHGLDQLWNKPFFTIASRAMLRLLATHAVVHIHPNNCCGAWRRDGIEIPRIAEFTFLRRDRFTSSRPATQFPHPLDIENTPEAPLPLHSSWWQPPMPSGATSRLALSPVVQVGQVVRENGGKI